MKIKKIIYQHRRDFSAIIECESCGTEEILKGGYDDDFYHTKVIPNIKCTSCSESSITSGANITPLTPKYPEGFQI